MRATKRQRPTDPEPGDLLAAFAGELRKASRRRRRKRDAAALAKDYEQAGIDKKFAQIDMQALQAAESILEEEEATFMAAGSHGLMAAGSRYTAAHARVEEERAQLDAIGWARLEAMGQSQSDDDLLTCRLCGTEDEMLPSCACCGAFFCNVTCLGSHRCMTSSTDRGRPSLKKVPATHVRGGPRSRSRSPPALRSRSRSPPAAGPHWLVRSRSRSPPALRSRSRSPLRVRSFVYLRLDDLRRHRSIISLHPDARVSFNHGERHGNWTQHDAELRVSFHWRGIEARARLHVFTNVMNTTSFVLADPRGSQWSVVLIPIDETSLGY